MNGGDVDIYGNRTFVKCYVTSFWLDYKNETGLWYRYHPVSKQSLIVPLSCSSITISIGNHAMPSNSRSDVFRIFAKIWDEYDLEKILSIINNY